MSADAALDLLLNLLRTVVLVAGPVLGVALVAGLVVGVLQAATQVNEASVSFVVKIAAVVGALLAFGPMLTRQVVEYTTRSLQAVEHVVR